MAAHGISNEVYELSKEATKNIILLIHGKLSADARCIADLFIRHLLTQLNFARSRVAIVQYGKGEKKIEHDFSADSLSLLTAAQNLSNISSWRDSDLHLGFEACIDLFTTQSNNAERVVCLIAQGAPNNKETRNAALRLRETLHTKIIAVGVGAGVSKDALEKVATLRQVYIISKLQDLRDSFRDVGAHTFSKPTIRMQRSYCDAVEIEIACAEEVTQFKVEKFDEAANTVDKYRVVKLITVPNPSEAIATAKISDLHPSQKVILRVSAVLKHNNRLTEAVLLNGATLEERQDSGVLRTPAVLAQKIAQMVAEIRAWTPDPYLAEQIGLNAVKIALLGRVGEGKSSFTNTISSVFFGQYHVVAMEMEHFLTVTTKLTEYPLHDTKIIVMDTFGWQEEGGNYSYHEQQLICNGVLGDGYEEGSEVTGEIAMNSTFNRAVHGVIIVCDVDAVTNKSYMARIKEFERNWKMKFGRSIVVALTKCDGKSADPHLVAHPEDIYNSDIIQKRIATLSMATGIARGDIYPCINRTSLNVANAAVCEYLALKVLHASLFTSVAGVLANEVRQLKRLHLIEPPRVVVDNAADQSLQLLVALPDGSFTELTLRERTIRELKEELVNIEELGLVGNNAKVFVYKVINGVQVEVTIRNDEGVRRLSPNQQVYVRVQ